jgi:23S rRNA (uridine2552-2'-O)-methyltransferase
MARPDEYYNRAKQEGYRARSAYKLQQIDERVDLLHAGATVVDLGAAPGGWLQVAAEAVGREGCVVGVDRQRIDPIEDVDARVEVIRGDITDEETKAAIRDRVGGVEVVLSDMAPDVTGEYDLDHARSIGLAEDAAAVARDVLEPGGDLVVKVFDGRDRMDFQDGLENDFEYVQAHTPDATRDSSSELYVIARGRLTAPVREGDQVQVEITDTGSEGDGVAHVEGYTLFVPGAEAGETIPVTVTEVKPTYGFAERID